MNIFLHISEKAFMEIFETLPPERRFTNKEGALIFRDYQTPSEQVSLVIKP